MQWDRVNPRTLNPWTGSKERNNKESVTLFNKQKKRGGNFEGRVSSLFAQGQTDESHIEHILKLHSHYTCTLHGV